jgi:hypothetical protein
MEKPNSAQVGSLSPAPPCARALTPSVSDRGVPPIGANPRALSPSPSRCPVGQYCRCCSSRPRARSLSLSLSLSLSRKPHLSVRPQPPAHVPRCGHAHDRTFSSHLRTSSPLLSLAPRSPTSPHSLAPSVEPPRPSLTLRTRPDKLRRRSPKTAAVLRPLLSPHRVHGLGKHRRITRNSRTL